MALAISPNPFSISSELGATQDITVSGLPYYNDPDNCMLVLDIKVNGTTVKTLSVEPTASSYTFSNIDFNAVKAAIYAAAVGQSLVGCVQVQAVNSRIIPSATTSLYTTVGNLTIAGRNSNWAQTLPTTLNPIDLDVADPTNLAATWTRPHTAFYARLKFYVGDKGDGTSTVWTLIFSRWGFTTSVNSDIKNFGGTDYSTAMANAMNGVSPKDLKLEMTTQFDDGSSTFKDLAVNGTTVIPGGVKKLYYDGSRVYIKTAGVWVGNRVYQKVAGVWQEVPAYVKVAGVWKESL